MRTMKKTSELGDLLASVERARAERHPDLDASFVRRVVEAQHEAGDDEQRAMVLIRTALEELLSTVPDGDTDA